MMKCRFFILLFCFALGCSSTKNQPMRIGSANNPPATVAPASKNRNQAIVTPETRLTGKVVRVNPTARFAVLNFPVGKVPGVGQQFSVFRGGLKVGEIKITGPQQDENTVGDILVGEAQIGDELRNN